MALYLTHILTFYLADIFWHSIWHSLWHFIWYYILTVYQVFYLTSLLTFYLNFWLTFSVTACAGNWDPAVPTEISLSQLGSGSARWELELAVEEKRWSISTSNTCSLSMRDICDNFIPTFFALEWNMLSHVVPAFAANVWRGAFQPRWSFPSWRWVRLHLWRTQQSCSAFYPSHGLVWTRFRGEEPKLTRISTVVSEELQLVGSKSPVNASSG